MLDPKETEEKITSYTKVCMMKHMLMRSGSTLHVMKSCASVLQMKRFLTIVHRARYLLRRLCSLLHGKTNNDRWKMVGRKDRALANWILRCL